MSAYPVPPSDREKGLYLSPNKWPFLLSGAAGLGVFLFCSGWFATKSVWTLPYIGFCIIYFANIGFCAFGSAFATRFDLGTHNTIRERCRNHGFSVDVFLPNCGEDIALLSNTFAAVKLLDYENINVWVLDDVGREEVKALATANGFHYLSRPNKGEMKKSGNMRYAFARTSGDLILVLDADFVPRPDFLSETAFYFSVEPRLGILQTPQFFRWSKAQRLVEQGGTYLQEVFHRLIQNFRDRWGAAVCTGSCALYRRAALAPVGGAYPVERSEDVNTGLYVLRTGWKIKYLPLVLSCGLSPDTVEAFFNQHYRWCSGSIHLITSRLFWSQPNVGLPGKFSYLLSILYYITSGTGIPFLFSLPTLINVWFFPQDFAIANYSLIIPAIIGVTLVRGLWARTPWNFSPVITAFAAGYTHFIALTDVVTGNVAPWIPTGAAAGTSKGSRYGRFCLAITVLPLLQLSILLSGMWLNRAEIDLQASVFAVSWFAVQLSIQISLLRELMAKQAEVFAPKLKNESGSLWSRTRICREQS